MPRIDIGELSLNVEERGSGDAFLFIPGVVGLLNAWEFQMAEFSRRYRCISFDHRGAATVPFYQSEDLHKAIEGSRLVIVEEGGHYSYRRHWQEWNRIVDAFLREMEGSS
jgi:pimeloyl-ACP methyl ester carboxylesterase